MEKNWSHRRSANVRYRTESIQRVAYSASTAHANGSCPESTMRADMLQATSTSSNVCVAIDNGAVNQEWRGDFARIYAARERCTSVQGGRVASVLCDSLSLVPPLVAVGMVLADDDLLAALRSATHEWRGNSQSAPLDQAHLSALAHRA